MYGMKIADYMKLHGLSPAQMAELIGVSRPTVVRYVQGNRYPNSATMRRIMAATQGEVTPSDFFGKMKWTHDGGVAA